MISHDSSKTVRSDGGTPVLIESTLELTPRPTAAAFPKAGRARHAKESRRFLLCLTAIALVSASTFLVALTVLAVLRFGSARAAVGYYIRGEALLLDSTEKTFGTAVAGSSVPVSYKITNVGVEPLRILGCRPHWNCTVPHNLPFTIGPGGSRELELTVQTPLPQFVPNPGSTPLNIPLILFTSSPVQSRVSLVIRGEVVRPPATTE